jgi:PAS domain S-box-containing protein
VSNAAGQDVNTPEIPLGGSGRRDIPRWRQRQWQGDVVGGVVFLSILVNGVFLFAALHKSPLSIFKDGKATVLFLVSVVLGGAGVAVLKGLGPRHFPLRYLAGSSVQAVILRQFLPVAAAAVVVFDVLNVSSYGHMRLIVSSFLVLLLSLVAIVYLSFRSAVVIGHRIEESLKASEDRYTILINSLKDHAVLLLDSEGRIITWNVGAERIFGYRSDEVMGDLVSRFFSPRDEEGEAMLRTFKEATLQGLKEDQGWRKRKDGSPFWAEIVTTPFADNQKALVGFTQIVRDITRRKQTEDTLTASLHEKEALLKEIHHRVKNNLQMISSLLRLQSENIQDPALSAIFLESQNRVRSMAIIHECLYQSPDLAHMDFSDYVDKLTDNLLRTYSVQMDKVSIRLDVDKVPLSLDIAIPCGLIITELVSNALKYAYPGARTGSILVKFRVLPTNKGYELTVADEGVGLSHPINFEATESLGLRLVQILTEQLRGKIHVANGGGTRFTITFKEPEGRS